MSDYVIHEFDDNGTSPARELVKAHDGEFFLDVCFGGEGFQWKVSKDEVLYQLSDKVRSELILCVYGDEELHIADSDSFMEGY